MRPVMTIDEAGNVDRSAGLARLDALATFMDAAFVIPGTNIRMGAAGIIGLVPVAGDMIATARHIAPIRRVNQPALSPGV